MKNNSVSIIIPTYNRCDILKKVLIALEAQTIEKNRFEVLVVDDGSSDNTAAMVKSFSLQSDLNIRYFFQQNKKQGAARNLGIQHARMPLLLFIGDDIVPAPGFIESHLYFHEKLENPEKSSVIGYTTWPDDIRVTPFMRYIGEFGHQFGYSLINSSGPLRFNFYYTSNLLVPASVLATQRQLFDEDFDVYGWEDIELGYRLENAGIKLFYNSSALAYHYHPVTVISFCKRQENVGKASGIFIGKHPELEWFLGDRNNLARSAKSYLKSIIYKIFINIIDSIFLISLPHKLYKFILDTHYAKAAMLAGYTQTDRHGPV